MARILIVDDEPMLRLSLHKFLTSAKHEVVLAGSAEEAMAKQQAVPADLAIVDLFLPGEDGFEIMRLFRNLFPEVAVIAMSGHGDAGGLLGMAEKLGAAAILQKPFNTEALKEAVTKALSGNGPRREK